MRFALNDGKSAYTLSFYPTHGNWDGKFHEIKVLVKTSGAQVRYRKGYFATSEPVYQASEVRAAVEAAVWSPVESAGLRLQVMVNPSKTPKMLELKIALDTRELRLAEDKGQWKGALDLCYVQLGPADKSVLFDYKHLNLNLEQKNYDVLMRMGIVLTYELRVAVENDCGPGAGARRFLRSAGNSDYPTGKIFAGANLRNVSLGTNRQTRMSVLGPIFVGQGFCRLPIPKYAPP